MRDLLAAVRRGSSARLAVRNGKRETRGNKQTLYEIIIIIIIVLREQVTSARRAALVRKSIRVTYAQSDGEISRFKLSRV